MAQSNAHKAKDEFIEQAQESITGLQQELQQLIDELYGQPQSNPEYYQQQIHDKINAIEQQLEKELQLMNDYIQQYARAQKKP